MSGALLAVASLLLSTGAVLADSTAINFEPAAYSLGSIDGQDGWQSDGAAGSGCAVYDHAVAAQSTYPSFETQSLRISSAVTSGCFGDQTFSRPLANEAGEATAMNNGQSGGSRQSHFEAQWQVASVTQTYQVGQYVVASPDRGDGARMSWIQTQDTPAGLEIDFYDYVDAAPYGSSSNLAAGCSVEDDFRYTAVATGLALSVPHTIRVTMDFVAGPRNDVVKVYVDSVLKHTGTSWEDYFRYCEETDSSRTVDSILFRTGGAPAPANAGNGYYIDNMSLVSSNPPASANACKKNGWQSVTRDDGSSFKNQGDCMQYVNTGK